MSLEAERISAEELFDLTDRKDIIEVLSGTKVILVPGISAFVGADIVSGLFSIDITHHEYSLLFLDLGTNGEMAFWDGEKLFVTSTAVGPVFEAGGISCGTAAIPGAISRVNIEMDGEDPQVKVETIRDKEPIGICGTGVLEAVSELVRNKIVDETGLLTDKYFEDGFPLTGGEKPVRITQSDIRAVQLGKAALIAAQKELLQGRKPKFVEVSGGYGIGFMPDKIRHLGLFLTE